MLKVKLEEYHQALEVKKYVIEHFTEAVDQFNKKGFLDRVFSPNVKLF